MIRVENLTKRFGQHLAVDSVSFTLMKGETMGLLGPNGAGKTTIMRMMTGYLPPTDGRVLIEGADIYEQPMELKKKIGYLPEHPPLYLDMTVREFLCFVAEIKGMRRSEIKEKVHRAVELCGIADKLDRLIGNLSKGYRQRVGLAQALVHEPEILILDEPTVGLDPRQIIEIRNLIKELGRERTVILSTHILQEVTSICRKVAIINNGRLVAFDYIENLSSELSGSVVLRLRVARPDRLDKGMIRNMDGVLDFKEESPGSYVFRLDRDDDLRMRIAQIVVSQDAGLLEMRVETMGIEEIFLKVVSGKE
jgi:ABC-2 type transport system ATP-binding protein